MGLKKISRAFRSRRKGIKSAAKERTVNLLPLQSVGVLPRLLTADLWAGRGRLPPGVASRWTGAKKMQLFLIKRTCDCQRLQLLRQRALYLYNLLSLTIVLIEKRPAPVPVRVYA